MGNPTGVPKVFSEKVIINEDLVKNINAVGSMAIPANIQYIGAEFPLPDISNMPVMMEHFHDLAKCINVLEGIANNNCNCKQGTSKCQSCQHITCQSCQFD